MDERVAVPTISVGQGKQNPQGHALPAGETVEAWASALGSLSDGECSWWSPHVWTRNYSIAADWMAAHGCAIDIDYEDPSLQNNKHTALPDEAWAEFYELASAGDIPGNLIHATPRGARVVFVFDEVCTHREQMKSAMEACADLVESSLERCDIEAQLAYGGGEVRAGFAVDRACLDLKRIFWAPKCRVAGARRNAPVVAIRSAKYRLAGLRVEREEHQPSAAPARAESTLSAAVDAWCESHPIDFSLKACPACGHNDCFGPLPDDPSKWFCFSANHMRDSGGVGQPGSVEGTGFGDALDLEAHRRKVQPAEVLRGDGFLVDDDLSHIDISGLIERGSKPKPAMAIRLINLEGSLSITPPPSIVDGILREQDFAVLYGPPGVGKSFVAMSLALSVANGCEWMGREMAAAGQVIYMAGEGVYGLGKRVMAWAGGKIPTRSMLWSHWWQINDFVPMLEPAAFRALLDSIEASGVRPRLIVVDTLARAMTGGDENSAKDMGLFVMRCGMLRDQTGAAVLLVHHTRGDGERERGSSALRGAADVMLAVSADEDFGGVKLTVDKSKDDEPPEPIAIQLERISMGHDERGKEIASLRAVLHSGKVGDVADGGRPMAILAVLRDQPAGAPEMSFTDIQLATKIPKTTIGRLIGKLESQGLVISRRSGNSRLARIAPQD